MTRYSHNLNGLGTIADQLVPSAPIQVSVSISPETQTYINNVVIVGGLIAILGPILFGAMKHAKFASK